MEGEKRNEYRVCLGNLKETDHFEDLHIDGIRIRKSVLKTQSEKKWTSFNWLRIWTGSRILLT